MPTGIGSIDVADIVKNSMIMERAKTTRLEKARQLQTIHVDVYTNINNYMTNFSTQLEALKTAMIAGSQATSSNTNAVTATIGADATNGVHTLEITKLAKANTISSDISWASPSTDTMNFAETITINQGATHFDVAISATDTLGTVRDNINKATGNTGVTASIINTAPNTYKLVLTSKQTGSANQISVSGDTNNILKLNTISVPGEDATFKFDGLDITRSSNVVNDLLPGLTLNLLSASAGAATITIAGDPKQNQNITTAVQNLLSSYNQILSEIDKAQADRDTQDETLPIIKSRLQKAMQSTLNLSPPYNTLESIGIITLSPAPSQKLTKIIKDQNGKDKTITINYKLSGQLTLNTDATKGHLLSSALNTNLSDVQALFNDAQNGLVAFLKKGAIDEITKQKDDRINNDVGLIFSKKKQLDITVRNLDDKINTENNRLIAVQDSLFRKYTKLNDLLSRLDRTRNFLDKNAEAAKQNR